MKRTLSILLALVLLLSIVPMTALTTAAVTTDEVASTGETYGVSAGDTLLAMLEKDTPAGDVMTINVNADISYYVTTQGDSSDNSYLRYACTVGQGKKILNLNGHQVHFYNDYSVIHDHYGESVVAINEKNRQCLFEIPTGADLTVNGDASGSVDSGLLQYHGKLLNKCDAVDQRDLFEIRGGNLTINSGRYLAGGETTSYEWTVDSDPFPGITVQADRKAWYLVSGSAIRAYTGNLTVNGGYFEGRGLEGYTNNRNCALFADYAMSSVVINDGHFRGASAANAAFVEYANAFGKLTVNAGIFELDHNDAVVGVVYRSYDWATSHPGKQGIFFDDPNPNTVYYYKEKSNSAFIEASQSDLVNHKSAFFRDSTVYQVYVDPKQGHRVNTELSSTPTGDLEFLVGGKKYTTSDDINWRKGSSMKVYIDPECLYFEDQKASAYGVSQTMGSTVRFDLIHYISDGNQPVIYEGETVTLSKSESGNYYIDLNNLSSKVKNALAEGETYCFKFTATENWKSRREFSIWHTGRFYVTVSQKVKQIFCQIDEPVYGVKPTLNVYYDYSKDWCEVNLVSWTYKTSESDSWHSMGSSDTFTRDKIYSANFIVNMKTGYTLADNAEFFVGGEKATITYQNKGGLIAYKEFDMRANPIQTIAIMDVPAPVAGEMPIYSCDYPGGYYYIDTQMRMDWCDSYGFRMMKTDTFEGGEDYIVEFHVTTTNGYQFASNVGATVNGYKANVTETRTDTYGTGHARVRYTFTCPDTIVTINTASVTITPKVGEELPYNATVPADRGYSVEDYSDGTDWKDGVKWTDKNGNNLPIGTKLEGGKTYTVWVSIEITDTDNYQFAPVDEFTGYLNKGYETEVMEYDEYNYGLYYTFTVPKIDEETKISSVAVTIPEPKDGEELSYTATVPSGKGYMVEDYDFAGEWVNGVKWQDQLGNAIDPALGETAQEGLKYTAIVSIVLTDDQVYAFDQENFTATINGAPIDGSYWYGKTNVLVWRHLDVASGSSSGSYIIGDTDTDKKITILDATAIQRKLANLAVAAFDETAADADEDDKLTILDATAIQRYLAALPTNPNIGTEKA